MKDKIEWADGSRNVIHWHHGKTREWYLAQLTKAIEDGNQAEFDRLMAEYRGRYQ